ncbi:MAG TPA: DNA mismatch repair endonuclease MutL [bacterium]|nr:DNA mismatch repair endonuclease MutL [bacterium]
MNARPPRAPITVLPRAAAERIAAGEVVERPASVVKELVENSLDAGAHRITIEIEDAGRRLIRVADDGEGIPADELATAFERFATSKIRSAEDLAQIRTYGFRGEALPSIAAVARVAVVTRVRGDDAAARIAVIGGAGAEVVPAAGAQGTTVTVEDLYFNTPARKEFLRSPARETAVIVDIVEALALAAPDVAFRLIDGGRELLWAPAEPFAARARRLLGPQLAPHTLEVNRSGRVVRLTGVIGTPQAAQRRRTHQWFLVNGRPIRSPLLARALATAFHTLIPDDRYPVAVLSLRIAPDEVDVNVHPRKAEVRFIRDGEIFDDVVREVRRALRETPLLHVVGPDHGGTPGDVRGETPRVAAAADLDVVPATEDRAGLSEPGTLWAPAPGVEAWPEIRLIGQLALTYLVGEADGDLVLIDQHAAHERVLYERLLDQRDAAGVRAQGLVVPVVLEVSRAEMTVRHELDPALRALGFEIEPFGPSAVRLTAVPAIAAARAPDVLLRACLHDLRGEPGPHAGRGLEERLAIATACHTAIRAGDRLDPAAMAALLRDLARTRDPFSCFHGRPTMVRVRARDLERWFYRRV